MAFCRCQYGALAGVLAAVLIGLEMSTWRNERIHLDVVLFQLRTRHSAFVRCICTARFQVSMDFCRQLVYHHMLGDVAALQALQAPPKFPSNQQVIGRGFTHLILSGPAMPCQEQPLPRLIS